MIKKELLKSFRFGSFVLVMLLSICSSTLFSQDLHWIGLDNIDQSNPLDPSYVKVDSGFTLVLPGLSATLVQDGPVLGDYFKETDPGVFKLDFTDVINDFDDENGLGAEIAIPLIELDWRKGKGMISLSYGLRVMSDLVYQKDLINLFHFGNVPFIGETMNLGIDASAFSYTELALGYSRDMGFINVGARVKLLSGIEDLSIADGKLDLYTDPDIYQLEVDSDIIINSSGSFDYNGLDDFSLDFNPVNYFQFGKNMGFAFDLGISGDLGDKFSYQLAALDIGSISWDGDSTFVYTSQDQTSFEGLDLLDFFDDEQDIVVEDSLYQILEFEKESISYSTDLYKKFIIGVNYQITDAIDLGGFYHINQYSKSPISSFGISSKYKFRNQTASLLIAAVNGNPVVGLGTVLNLGPVQLIATTDNVLGVLGPDKVKYSSSRVGLNVSF